MVFETPYQKAKAEKIAPVSGLPEALLSDSNTSLVSHFRYMRKILVHMTLI